MRHQVVYQDVRPYWCVSALCMVPASWLRDTLGVRRAAFADTFNAAEVMAMRPEDVNARQVQRAFADGATLDELEKPIAVLRSPGAPGDAHPVISFNDDDDHKLWKTGQPTREDDTQTVTLGAAKLQVTPMACRHLRGGSHAL
jgi:hypothetical protein